jgi:hypothetical protein
MKLRLSSARPGLSKADCGQAFPRIPPAESSPVVQRFSPQTNPPSVTMSLGTSWMKQLCFPLAILLCRNSNESNPSAFAEPGEVAKSSTRQQIIKMLWGCEGAQRPAQQITTSHTTTPTSTPPRTLRLPPPPSTESSAATSWAAGCRSTCSSSSVSRSYTRTSHPPNCAPWLTVRQYEGPP